MNGPTTPAAAGFTRRQGLIALLGGAAALSGCGGGGGRSDGGVRGTMRAEVGTTR